MRISKKFLDNVKNGFMSFEREPMKEVFYVMRLDDSRYIEFMMFKHHYYYGEASYSCFEGASYVCGWTKDALEEMLTAEDRESIKKYLGAKQPG